MKKLMNYFLNKNDNLSCGADLSIIDELNQQQANKNKEEREQAKMEKVNSAENKSENKKNSIVIFTPQKARKLLRKGFTIVDIKPDKNDPDKKKSLFVFRNDEGIYEALSEILDELDENKSNTKKIETVTP